ncbi:MAG: 16S rRNA (guanine(966)-N(2))-methyltransferase RsmD [Candidatus Pelagibacter sp.]|nr:16S rRNA (guanine(966)-N(2))-methyltransferase RsmD [Candidatus Pelagibacter sp.]OUV87736.1 MAG: 16S rRNA (guanine(966)-N(2))-methyltransferase RsmD [Pelagibacteraceae bacterium TMED136]|tara:strand:- start:3189 stop:3752 length:564 start_codon:yes stop_codon:yes gene_type:complete
MRIISGLKKGKKILLPDPNITRPLKDNVKENIFNILLHSRKFHINFENTKIIDFFSGSGSFGLECISRGSKHVKFIEDNPKIQNTLYRNLSNNFDKNKFDIIKKDFFKLDKKNLIETFHPNLIFLDPPYKIESFNKILEFLDTLSNYKNLIIIFHVEKTKNLFIKQFKFDLEKVYGMSKILFLKTNS